jgi:PPK2 family polyphosphate:nucleotide phosphotransferase
MMTPALRIDTDQYLVRPATEPDLSEWATSSQDGFDGSKAEAAEVLEALNLRLAELQELLYAGARHKVLVVLQGMDTSGKDGTIKHVFRTVNPSGVQVASFKRPHDIELAHDYLWRVHHHTPSNGQLVIFNRSHYEDVLVVRVHDLVPEEVWRRRYEHIVAFERMLADEGTVIVKVFLHISRDEQKQRLQARLDDSTKRWKFQVGDIDERALWDRYEAAYEDAIGATSTEHGPWYVVPADRKWYRNLVVSQLLIDTLERLDMQYPDAAEDLDHIVLE